MDESVGKGPGVENEVWQSLPKLDASGVVADDFARAAGQAMTSSSADTAKDEPSQAAPEPTRNGILPRSSRLTMMAAPLAAAAVLGSFVGSLTASGVTQFWPVVAPSSSSGAAWDTQAPNAELAALSALKTYVEGAARNTNNQFATLANRLDRIERTQADPNLKLARIAGAVDRLEKQRKSAMAAVAAPAAAAPEITGTVKPITFDARNLGASHRAAHSAMAPSAPIGDRLVNWRLSAAARRPRFPAPPCSSRRSLATSVSLPRSYSEPSN